MFHRHVRQFATGDHSRCSPAKLIDIDHLYGFLTLDVTCCVQGTVVRFRVLTLHFAMPTHS